MLEDSGTSNQDEKLYREWRSPGLPLAYLTTKIMENINLQSIYFHCIKDQKFLTHFLPALIYILGLILKF